VSRRSTAAGQTQFQRPYGRLNRKTLLRADPATYRRRRRCTFGHGPCAPSVAPRGRDIGATREVITNGEELGNHRKGAEELANGENLGKPFQHAFQCHSRRPPTKNHSRHGTYASKDSKYRAWNRRRKVLFESMLCTVWLVDFPGRQDEDR